MSDQVITNLVQAVLESGITTTSDTSIQVYNLQFIYDRLDEIKNCFPKNTLHSAAIKANPFQSILNEIVSRGFGLEAASLPELEMAIDAGAKTDHILFDSPAKTKEELRFAMLHGVGINADNFDELSIIKDLPPGQFPKLMGLRINPQIGIGSIASTSVGSFVSKFGVPFSAKQEIIEAYKNNPWLNTIHLHSGSQGMPIGTLVEAVKRITELAGVINRETNGQIKYFDLGGGMPVTYQSIDEKPSMQAYAEMLKKVCPVLFDGTFQLLTEFGRYIHTNAGFTMSKIEYVKNENEGNIVVIHSGADHFLRECYHPNDWPHEIVHMDASGKVKTGSPIPHSIAGPLCFAGDYPIRNANLYEPEPGDWIIIKDTGAYTLSMWSRYNSRQFPLVLGIDHKQTKPRIIKPRESIEQVKSFWK